MFLLYNHTYGCQYVRIKYTCNFICNLLCKGFLEDTQQLKPFLALWGLHLAKQASFLDVLSMFSVPKPMLSSLRISTRGVSLRSYHMGSYTSYICLFFVSSSSIITGRRSEIVPYLFCKLVLEVKDKKLEFLVSIGVMTSRKIPSSLL